MTESLRRRVPFVSAEADDEDTHILDEQEQDELIQKLKDQSTQSILQYNPFLYCILALSLILHIIYLNKRPRISPLENLFPSDKYTQAVPIPYVFTLVNLLAHCLLIFQLCDPSNVARDMFASNFPEFFLHTYAAIFVACSLAPALALIRGGNWQDVTWWTVTDALALFIYSAQKWSREEAESIQRLENLRYTAKGA